MNGFLLRAMRPSAVVGAMLALLIGFLAVSIPTESEAAVRSRSVSRSRVVNRGNAQQVVAVQQVQAVHHHKQLQVVAPVVAAPVYAAPLQLVVPQAYVAPQVVAPQQLNQGCSTGLQLNAANSCAAFWP